jgi:hypothetical protein
MIERQRRARKIVDLLGKVASSFAAAISHFLPRLDFAGRRAEE